MGVGTVSAPQNSEGPSITHTEMEQTSGFTKTVQFPPNTVSTAQELAVHVQLKRDFQRIE